MEDDGGVLVNQAVDGGYQFVFISSRLGLHREGDDRRRHLTLGIDDRRLFGTQGIPGRRFFEFGNGRDVPGDQHLHRFLDLSLQEKEGSDPFIEFAGGIVEPLFGLQRARINAKQGEATCKGIRNGLEDQR